MRVWQTYGGGRRSSLITRRTSSASPVYCTESASLPRRTAYPGCTHLPLVIGQLDRWLPINLVELNDDIERFRNIVGRGGLGEIVRQGGADAEGR